MTKKQISIVIPVHNEQENIIPLTEKIESYLKDYKLNIIYVNDHSSDNTLETLHSLAKADSLVGYISFTRQYGKESGLLAGLRHARGDYIGIMDADFQDPPELLSQMTHFLNKNQKIDVVAAKKQNYHNSNPIGSFLSQLFYSLSAHLTGASIPNGSRDFRLMRKRVVDDYLKYSEHTRFSRYIFDAEGYNVKYITFPDAKRRYGKSSWSLNKLFDYALTGIIGNGSAIPELIVKTGSIFSAISLILSIIGLFKLQAWQGAEKWFLLFLLLSLILTAVGITGVYTGKILTEVKDRPDYLIRQMKLPKNYDSDLKSEKMNKDESHEQK